MNLKLKDDPIFTERQALYLDSIKVHNKLRAKDVELQDALCLIEQQQAMLTRQADHIASLQRDLSAIALITRQGI